MASFCRIVATAAKKNVWSPAVRCASSSVKVTLGSSSVVQHAANLQTQTVLPKASSTSMSGNDNPFDVTVMKKGPGTKGDPTEIPSAFDARLIGCICEDDSTSISWMWLHKGEPRSCECGHWYKLVHKAPL
ncbi:cytochrome c oxidase subunit 5B, mitochondrial-like isoform X1 [Euwallacea similis]|uniref:cytochrome c oxidase subunit 5B, mitochondrial-like isoform X1 n=1 Tax=Euwallacea similis TaxID=1736056 RepID=UPI00344D024B